MIDAVMLLNHKRSYNVIDSSYFFFSNLKMRSFLTESFLISIFCYRSIVDVLSFSTMSCFGATITYIRRFRSVETLCSLRIGCTLHETMLIDFL